MVAQTIQSDPNWLLSSVAQSTAALVAIIGGLIASRLITLSGERGLLVERDVQAAKDRREIEERRTCRLHSGRCDAREERLPEGHSHAPRGHARRRTYGPAPPPRYGGWVPSLRDDERARYIEELAGQLR